MTPSPIFRPLNTYGIVVLSLWTFSTIGMCIGAIV